MKALMIAPEPFFQPRGTPFSEYYRIRCLSQLGHDVDLVTYPIGENVTIPRLRIIRTAPVPGVTDIKIGPSWQKIPLDMLLFFAAWRRIASNRYDLIHSHEEAGIMGLFFSRLYGIPHLYDMHSSLPQQMENFRFTDSRLITAGFRWMEEAVINSADAVIAICPALVETVLRINPRANVVLIENTAESHQVDNVPDGEVEAIRSRLNLGGKKIILYIGTFEAYQGLDLLLEAGKVLSRKVRDIALLLVGGKPEQVDEQRTAAQKLGIGDICCFTGQIQHERVPPYLKLADVLVSPRSSGTNTPLKIYSFLRAGAPIIATDLPTHTQVLNEDVAVLVRPEPGAFAGAIEKLLADPALGGRLSAEAGRLSEEKYSYKRYVEKTKRVYDDIEALKHGKRQ